MPRGGLSKQCYIKDLDRRTTPNRSASLLHVLESASHRFGACAALRHPSSHGGGRWFNPSRAHHLTTGNNIEILDGSCRIETAWLAVSPPCHHATPVCTPWPWPLLHHPRIPFRARSPHNWARNRPSGVRLGIKKEPRARRGQTVLSLCRRASFPNSTRRREARTALPRHLQDAHGRQRARAFNGSVGRRGS